MLRLLLLLLLLVRSDAHATDSPNLGIPTYARDDSAAAVAHRRLAVAAFEIPVFALTFRSPNVLQGNVAEDLVLLGSTLAGPLEEILGEFCHESFRIQTARLSQNEAPNTALPEMVLQLLAVDFDVTVVYQPRNPDEDQNRHLQTEWLDYYAQFVGVAKFVQPLDPADQPTDDYMQQLLGSWVHQYLVEDFTVLESMMRASEDPVLKNMEYLAVVEDPKRGVFPYTVAGTNNDNQGSSGDANHKLTRLLLSLLVVVATATMAAVFFLVRPHMATHRAKQLGAFPRQEDPAHRLSLAGRGGDDDIDPQALEESDRWLKQHRPDLFRVIQRTAPARSVQGADTNEGVMNEKGSHRSNPLQFLYGGMFVRKHKLSEPPLNLARGDSELEELETGEEPTMATTPSWWQKLALSLHGRPLACEEDPSQYDFAFSDFPRHDGTPCLIYQETENGPIAVMSAPPGGASTNQSLSNDAFLRQLSMHGENVTFEEKTASLDEEDLASSPEFTNKLERLVAMRHRHYEKERLIQKGRKARNQERKKAEARERELKLRRHEMELDLGEIEASLTPRALSRKNFGTPETVTDGRRAHRVTVSDSEYMKAVEGNGTSAHDSPSRSRGQGELGTIGGGPNLRYDYNESMNGRRPAQAVDHRHARNRSDILPGTPQARSLTPSPEKRHRAHRRSLSHGTEEMEEKKVDHPVGRQRSGSTAEDVMAFGIAAYNFV